jgi:hypothetical protein
VEFEGEGSKHVDREGHACNGRTFDVTVGSVNDKDPSLGTLILCRACRRDLSLENGKLFDPYPPRLRQ